MPNLKTSSCETKQAVAQYWDKTAEEFDAIYTGKGKRKFRRWLDKFFRADIYERYNWVMRKSGDVRGKTICDLGCGSGRFVAELAKRGAARVVGVDIAPDMLKLARQLVAEQGVAGQCDFVHSDVLDWKTDEKFDETIAIGFWDYVKEPSRHLRIIRSATKTRFLSAWPRFWTWRMPVRKVRLQYLCGCPVYFFRKPRIYRMLSEAGFEVVSCETVGKLYCVEAKPR